MLSWHRIVMRRGTEQAPESEKARTWYSELSLVERSTDRNGCSLIPILYALRALLTSRQKTSPFHCISLTRPSARSGDMCLLRDGWIT